MPNAQNFGTGYADWGNYVNANQPTIDRDRQKVKDYMSGEDTQARSAAQGAFADTGYNTAAGQGYGGQAQSGAWPTQQAGRDIAKGGSGSAINPPQQATPLGKWNTLFGDVSTNQAALASPEGFEQVLSRANQNYDPTNTKGPQGTAKAPTEFASNPFNAQLEGQNAKGLYSGADALESYAKSFAPPVAPGAGMVGGTPYSGPYPSNAGVDDSGNREGYQGTSTVSNSSGGTDDSGGNRGGGNTGTTGVPEPTYDPNDPWNKYYGSGG